MSLSIWNKNVKMPQFESLKGDHQTKVLIIGGGLCGILCAHFLQEAGVDYMLAEADEIGRGVTQNTTAKITAQHGLIYETLIKRFGAAKAGQYLRAHMWALEKYGKLAADIDCDFEKKDAYVYATDYSEKLVREMEAVNRLGFNARFCREVPLPFPTEGAVCFPDQAQFHPLKFIAGIADGLNIYEHTMIRELAPHTAIYDGGKITAEQIIVATHFPMINKHGLYFMKLYQHRSYALALSSVAPLPDGMYIDAGKKGFSFRNYKDLLILGGGSHRTGKTGGCWQVLEAAAGQYYPQAKITHRWAAQDCMSLDKMPYVGPYAVNMPGVYVAAGFNKWGMTSSMAAAQILCAEITGNYFADWQQLFWPRRSVLRPQLFVNIFETTINFLTPTLKRCPHLGCALKWNPAEHSWDCACHGSRFEPDGSLINNPAMGDAHIKRGQKNKEDQGA